MNLQGIQGMNIQEIQGMNLQGIQGMVYREYREWYTGNT